MTALPTLAMKRKWHDWNMSRNGSDVTKWITPEHMSMIDQRLELAEKRWQLIVLYKS